MKHRRLAVAVVAVSLVVYLAGFALDHVDYDETDEATEQLWNAIYTVHVMAPLVGTAAATQRWPTWWVVPVAFTVVFAIPFGVYEVELSTGVAEPVDSYCDPCVDIRILSLLAVPAAVVAAVGVGVAKWRLSRLET